MILSAETEAVWSCRSSGVWVRGVWMYHRTRTQPLPPGTRRSGQLDQWHILQTASPHTLLPGKEIKLSVSQGSSDGNPALLLFGTAFGWSRAFTRGKFTQFCHFVAVPAREILVSCSLSVAVPHLGGCHAEKLKSAGTSGWILVNKWDFTGWLFACPFLSPTGIIATEQEINKVLLCVLSIWDLEP